MTNKMIPTSEIRRFSRLPVKALCCLTDQGESGQVTLVDISLKGALLEVEGKRSLPVGRKCLLNIPLIPSKINLDFHVEVLHTRDTLVGVRFYRMDLETMIHLRGLLEAITGDPDRIRDEIGALVE